MKFASRRLISKKSRLFDGSETARPFCRTAGVGKTLETITPHSPPERLNVHAFLDRFDLILMVEQSDRPIGAGARSWCF
jgi:hypothetical protein